MNQITQIKPSDIINSNLTKHNLYYNSMKVFLYSYYGWDSISEQNRLLYHTNLDSFHTEMEKLFDKQFDKTATVEKIMEEINNCEYVLRCGVLQIKGVSQFQTVGVTIDVGITGQRTQHISLNVTKTDPTNSDTYLANIKPNILRQLRSGNNAITIKLYVNDSPVSGNATHDFIIQYQMIHSEGFMDWHVFSREQNQTIEALIKIKLSLLANNSTSFSQSEQIHNHLVMNILQYRLREVRKISERKAKQYIRKAHSNQTIVNRKKTDFLIKSVNANTQTAFWLKPFTELPYFQELSTTCDEPFDWQKMLRSDRLTTVKYNELDMSCDFWTEICSQVNCVCDEWCNWSSFYYFNPILRFLMVQHNNLFMANNAKLAEIYLFFTSYYINEAQNTPVTTTPLFDLLKSAKYYCETSNDVSLVNQTHRRYRETYAKHSFSPKARVSAAIAYNLLRDQFKVKQIIAGSVWFEADIEDVHTFYEVLLYLHHTLNGDREIIPAQRLDNWMSELVSTSRSFYHKVLESMLDKTLTVSNDDLFSDDYRKQSLKLTDDNQLDVIRFRHRLLTQCNVSRNPYNEQFSCSGEYQAITMCCNYLTTVSSVVTVGEQSDDGLLKNEQIYCASIDDKLNKVSNSIKIISYSKTEMQTIPAVKLTNNSVLEDQVIHIYYALKVYRILHDIQCHIIIGFCLRNRVTANIDRNKKLATKRLKFVFRNEWIEAIVNTVNKDYFVYNENTDSIVNEVKGFYQFWGKGRHETQQQPGVTDANRIEWLIVEYGRLYHWWKKDGNNALIFLKIISTCNHCLDNVLLRTQNIFSKHVIDVWCDTINITYGYKTEIVDLIVYWLVCSVCTKFVKIAANILNAMHSLENDSLRSGDWMKKFAFTKPGYVPIVRIYKTIVSYVEQIKSLFIEYDDEFDRIDTALCETRRMIKMMFRDYWKYMISIWWQEIENLLNFQFARQFQTQVNTRNKAKLVTIHTIVGISVIYPFINDFRKDSFRFRKAVQKKVDTYRQTPIQLQGRGFKAMFVRVWNHFTQLYTANNAQHIDIAIPLVSEVWRTLLTDQIRDFEAINIQ